MKPTDLEARLLAKLITAIGMSDATAPERSWFENEFHKIKQNYLDRMPVLEAEAKYRKLLRRFLANAEDRRELRRQLAPFAPELARVRSLRLNNTLNTTNLSEQEWKNLVMSTNPNIIALAEQAEVGDINIFLSLADDYRKDPVRKLAVEPLLALLRDEGVLGEDMVSTHELPLNRMVETFLDFVGVSRAQRQTNLRVVVQYIRGLEKQPAKRPRGPRVS